MADIELVIKISKEQYDLILKSHIGATSVFVSKECMMYSIKNATLLPEHHGRLIDVDEYYIGSFNDAREFLYKASTIIPATKEDKQTERKCASCIYHDERGGCLDSCAICRYTPKQTATKEGE